jgi:hypothetical protein
MKPVAGSHSGEFLRLARLLQLQTHFSFVFAAVDNPQYRSDLIHRFSSTDRIETAFAAVNVVEQTEIQSTDEPLALIKHCESAQKKGATRLHLCFELDQSMKAQWWQQVNLLRERIADAFPHTLVFWMSDSQITLAASQAPDLWNWRTAVFSFASEPNDDTLKPELTSPAFNSITHIEAKSAQARLQDIKDYLQQHTGASTSYLLLEAADIEDRLGDLTSALNHTEQAVKLFEESNNTHLVAVTKGKIADIYHAQDRLAEAVTIWTNDVLPVFRNLGLTAEVQAVEKRISSALKKLNRN